MPRTADHSARRAQLADATLDVAASAGLDAVTVAGVAREAGYSVGLVQHYFVTKAELVQASYLRASQRLVERVESMIEDQERLGAAVAHMMSLALSELLPLGGDRRVEASVRAQFRGRAANDPVLAAVAEQFGANVRQRLLTAITNGRECGETATDAVDEVAAWQLWSVADGLGAAMLHNPSVPAAAVIDDMVYRVFPNPCQRRLAVRTR